MNQKEIDEARENAEALHAVPIVAYVMIFLLAASVGLFVFLILVAVGVL